MSLRVRLYLLCKSRDMKCETIVLAKTPPAQSDWKPGIFEHTFLIPFTDSQLDLGPVFD